jgi:DNA-binding transcriptional MerR regulator
VNIKELLIQENLPKKSLVTVNEVATFLKVKPHEIRYWESEFQQIRPQKNKYGQRLYRKEDIILFTAIKHLLHDKKFTVAAASQILADSEILEQRLTNKGHDELLQASEDLLPKLDSSFDEQTHEIYQHCASDLEENKSTKKAALNTLEYEKALTMLNTSRTQLNEVLAALEKFNRHDFWNNFHKSLSHTADKL